MSPNPKNTELQHDDIDLIVLLQRGISFFKKHKWIFIAATVTGLLLGFLRYRSLSPIYQSRFILQSTILSNQNAIQIVTNWNALLKNREIDGVLRVGGNWRHGVDDLLINVSQPPACFAQSASVAAGWRLSR